MKKLFLILLAFVGFMSVSNAQSKKAEKSDGMLEESAKLKDQTRALLLFVERCYNDISGEELVDERERAAAYEQQIAGLEKKQPAEPECMSEYCDNVYFAKVNLERLNELVDNKELNPNYREMVLPLTKGEEFTLAKAHVGLNTYSIQNYKKKIEKGGDYGILISKAQETLVKGLTYVDGEVSPEEGTETDLIRTVVESNLVLKNL